MELTPEIRKRLKSVMDSKNETGYSINKKTGISATTIGNYVNEDSKTDTADDHKLEAICKLLEIDINWLQYGGDIVKSTSEMKSEQEKETPETMLKQIFLKLNSRDEQFNYIRKENHTLKENINKITQGVDKLAQEMTDLKAEIKKLKKE